MKSASAAGLLYEICNHGRLICSRYEGQNMIIYLSMLETDADRDVFQKLCEENEQAFFLAAMKILHNEADAEDAVQSCFLKMIENFASYRHKPYIDLVRICYVVTKHNAIDILRERQKKADFIDETYQWEENTSDSAPDILEQIIQKYEQNLVKQALEQLKPEEYELIELQYMLGIKPKEIAELLGMTSAMVRKKMLRCRNKLAKILEGYEDECLR